MTAWHTDAVSIVDMAGAVSNSLGSQDQVLGLWMGSEDGYARFCQNLKERLKEQAEQTKHLAIELRAQDLRWVTDKPDDHADQCLHGAIYFSIDGTAMILPEDGEWTLSAAGLFLLRTLEHDHTEELPVTEGNFLIPCCGFTPWDCGDRFEVLCQGCNTGIDFWITHTGDNVTIRFKDCEYLIPLATWRLTVFQFVDQVERYYRSCSAKDWLDDKEDCKGWAAFWHEWSTRRGRTFMPVAPPKPKSSLDKWTFLISGGIALACWPAGWIADQANAFEMPIFILQMVAIGNPARTRPLGPATLNHGWLRSPKWRQQSPPPSSY